MCLIQLPSYSNNAHYPYKHFMHFNKNISIQWEDSDSNFVFIIYYLKVQICQIVHTLITFAAGDIIQGSKIKQCLLHIIVVVGYIGILIQID